MFTDVSCCTLRSTSQSQRLREAMYFKPYIHLDVPGQCLASALLSGYFNDAT